MKPTKNPGPLKSVGGVIPSSLRAGLYCLALMLALVALNAQGGTGTVTFDYETVTGSSTTFSSSGQTWTLTGDMINEDVPGYGSPEPGTASPCSEFYMDTVYNVARALGNVGGIQAPSGYTFRALGFDIWPSANSGGSVYGGG